MFYKKTSRTKKEKQKEKKGIKDEGIREGGEKEKKKKKKKLSQIRHMQYKTGTVSMSHDSQNTFIFHIPLCKKVLSEANSQ